MYLNKILKNTKDYVVIVFGSFITAVATNMLLVPNKIAPGGVSGIATVLYYLFHFPVGTTMLILNIPLFLLGIRYMGGLFSVKTIFATVALSGIIDSTSFLPVLTRDPLLASLYGGALLGGGLGIVFRAGATTGGTDMAAKFLNRIVPHFTVGQLMLFVDFTIIIFAAIVFRNYDLALYAIVTLFIASKIIDALLEGVNFAKAVFIISDKSQYIAEKIITDLDRGVTGLRGVGMYTGEDKTVLMCVLRRSEIPTLKSLVQKIDKDAFVILTDVREVLGEGFNK